MVLTVEEKKHHESVKRKLRQRFKQDYQQRIREMRRVLVNVLQDDLHKTLETSDKDGFMLGDNLTLLLAADAAAPLHDDDVNKYILLPLIQELKA